MIVDTFVWKSSLKFVGKYPIKKKCAAPKKMVPVQVGQYELDPKFEYYGISSRSQEK